MGVLVCSDATAGVLGAAGGVEWWEDLAPDGIGVLVCSGATAGVLWAAGRGEWWEDWARDGMRILGCSLSTAGVVDLLVVAIFGIIIGSMWETRWSLLFTTLIKSVKAPKKLGSASICGEGNARLDPSAMWPGVLLWGE
jgi:hypothetical protein